MPAGIPEATPKPSAYVRRPGGGRLRPGQDYPDEGIKPAIIQRPDDISVCVGQHIYIENGRLPWTFERQIHSQVPPEPFSFSRVYPVAKLAIDIWPDRNNLMPEKKAEFNEKSAFRAELCATHGWAYIAMYTGDVVDRKVFVDAMTKRDQALKNEKEGK